MARETSRLILATEPITTARGPKPFSLVTSARQLLSKRSQEFETIRPCGTGVRRRGSPLAIDLHHDAKALEGVRNAPDAGSAGRGHTRRARRRSDRQAQDLARETLALNSAPLKRQIYGLSASRGYERDTGQEISKSVFARSTVAPSQHRRRSIRSIKFALHAAQGHGTEIIERIIGLQSNRRGLLMEATARSLCDFWNREPARLTYFGTFRLGTTGHGCFCVWHV